MSAPKSDPSVVRRRNLARAARLKRRLTTASVISFAAFFGLAAQHVVRGASASTRHHDPMTAQRAASASTTFFDQGDSGFSFGNPVSGLPAADAAPAPQPMAQTSVS